MGKYVIDLSKIDAAAGTGVTKPAELQYLPLDATGDVNGDFLINLGTVHDGSDILA